MSHEIIACNALSAHSDCGTLAQAGRREREREPLMMRHRDYRLDVQSSESKTTARTEQRVMGLSSERKVIYLCVRCE